MLQQKSGTLLSYEGLMSFHLNSNTNMKCDFLTKFKRYYLNLYFYLRPRLSVFIISVF